MNTKFDNNQPIYLQIVKNLEEEIISGARSPGARIETVRDMALKLKVNPNTVQRAFSELETKNLIITERTNGRYVTLNEKLISSLREKYLKDRTKTYLSEMKKLNVEKQELITFIKNNY